MDILGIINTRRGIRKYQHELIADKLLAISNLDNIIDGGYYE